MARDFAEAFYNGRPWRLTRCAYARSRHYTCERCGAPAPVGLELERDRDDGPRGIVHHRVELTQENILDNRIAYGYDNLELLCQTCHNREHHGSGAISEGLAFDVNGDVVRAGSPRAEVPEGGANTEGRSRNEHTGRAYGGCGPWHSARSGRRSRKSRASIGS